MRIQRSITLPIRKNVKWDERWKGEDQGVIACWERGREMRLENAELASEACNGSLVVLPWKGGVEKAIKKPKVGTLKYLAMWQGLRGEDLNIDLSNEIVVTCAATGMSVTFTGDLTKLSEP